MPQWGLLSADERNRLEALVQTFVATKRWEAATGFDLTEEMTVRIGADACLLVLELGLEAYRDVTSIIVHPSTVVRRGEHHIGGGIVVAGPTALHGEARLHGPVLLVWDAVVGAARHPERGHNVVFHEFAHKLDMLDGAADGLPPFRDRADLLHADEVLETAYRRLAAGHELPPIDGYAATNRAELFAVLTEAFFEVPVALRHLQPDLYEVLVSFYRQDPAARATASAAGARFSGVSDEVGQPGGGDGPADEVDG
jgi:Mlc titration factor MtfA (ptsG expression regulator)